MYGPVCCVVQGVPGKNGTKSMAP